MKVWFQNRRIKWRKQSLEKQHAKMAAAGLQRLYNDDDDDDDDDDVDDEAEEVENVNDMFSNCSDSIDGSGCVGSGGGAGLYAHELLPVSGGDSCSGSGGFSRDDLHPVRLPASSAANICDVADANAVGSTTGQVTCSHDLASMTSSSSVGGRTVKVETNAGWNFVRMRLSQ